MTKLHDETLKVDLPYILIFLFVTLFFQECESILIKYFHDLNTNPLKTITNLLLKSLLIKNKCFIGV